MTEMAAPLIEQYGMLGVAVVGIAYLVWENVKDRRQVREDQATMHKEHREEMNKVHDEHKRDIMTLQGEYRSELKSITAEFSSGLHQLSGSVDNLAGEVREIRKDVDIMRK